MKDFTIENPFNSSPPSSPCSSLSSSDQERLQFILHARQVIDKFSSASPQESSFQNVNPESFVPVPTLQKDPIFVYEGQHYPEIPKDLQGVDCFAQVIKQNSGLILASLTSAEKEKLFQYLPQTKDKERLLAQVLKGEKVGQLGTSPLQSFSEQIEKQFFSEAHQEYLGWKEQLALVERKERIENDLAYLQRLEKQLKNEKQRDTDKLMSLLFAQQDDRMMEADGEMSSAGEDDESDSYYDQNNQRRKRGRRVGDPMTEEEKQIYDGIHAEYDELTSGYSTISSNKGEQSLRKQQIPASAFPTIPSRQSQAQAEASNQNQTGVLHISLTPTENEKPVKSKAEKIRAQIECLTKKEKAKKVAREKGKHVVKKVEKIKGQKNLNKALQEPKIVDEYLEMMMNTDRFRNVKDAKNQVTIPPSNPLWVETFQRQELERYRYPHRPWVYYNEDGSTSIVGPVVKKKIGQTNQKPREHPLLNPIRPPFVTHLTLARDAASRLPDGVGTKADIIELIKQSQWIRLEGMTLHHLNNTIGGTLDRLQYDDDPCVKYDADKKVWSYLHRDRKSDHPNWQLQAGAANEKEEEEEEEIEEELGAGEDEEEDEDEEEELEDDYYDVVGEDEEDEDIDLDLDDFGNVDEPPLPTNQDNCGSIKIQINFGKESKPKVKSGGNKKRKARENDYGLEESSFDQSLKRIKK